MKNRNQNIPQKNLPKNAPQYLAGYKKVVENYFMEMEVIKNANKSNPQARP